MHDLAEAHPILRIQSFLKNTKWLHIKDLSVAASPVPRRHTRCVVSIVEICGVRGPELMSVARHKCPVIFALVLFLGIAAQPASATLPAPSQPILVVQNSSSADPYQNFVPELLTTEGLNGFQTAQLPDLTAAFLANYDVVVLPHLTLTSAQATLFQNYVNAGGVLIGFRPDLQLANVFGVASLGTTLSEGWLKIDTTTAYGSGLDSSVMKFHGTADLYSLSGASALATLYNSSTLPTSSPAASIYTFGSGKAILFSLDLTQSIVLMRQGNPAWAGYPNNHDGYNTMRASQMFKDQGSGQFWNDLGDGALNDVPQADIQMHLFSNGLVLTNAARRPLPRLWYFPSQNRSVLLFTGDHHGDPVSNSISEINTVQSFGGKFSEFLWYPFGTISESQVNTWLAAGHAIGVHFDDTAEVDSSGVGGSAASWTGMQSVISSALSSFTTTFPGAPTPVTTRDHFLIWVSRNAAGNPDQTAQAKLFQNVGIQLDTSYSAFPNRWGYMSGSGLPMKFLDTTTGTVIPVLEQATQYEDDVQLSNANYSANWDVPTAQSHYQKSLSDSLTKYNTVVTMLFHPDHWSTYSSYAQTVLQYAQSNSIPMMNTATWLQFWNARAATALSTPSFTSNTLAFTATGSPAGLTLLIPDASGSKVVSTFQVDGAAQSFAVAAYQGVMYAGVALAAGTHSISVTYATAGRILGQISPSAAANATTLQIQGGSITQTVSPAADGTYATIGLPAGTYTVTPSSSSYTFTPSSRSVTIVASDVSNVNFTGTANPAGQTLFTTQVPAITNASDGGGVNYELGMAFTSTSAGQITAIRFWKASSESGTHTGRIWSSTGSLLASATFAGETASGWQQQNLSSPISIAANTTYIVSVNTGNSFYVDTNSGLASQIANGNLRSVVGSNGLYGSPGQFPTNSWQGSNYFRDIAFVPVATYSVSGTISPSANGSGATVTLSGAASASTTADSSGNYTFSGLNNGSYTVTPSKSGFTFSPTSALATVSNANVTALNFTAAAIPTYSISGTISPTANGSGATVTLGGAASATATADASGNYSFTGLANGSYTVTPSKAGFAFSPMSMPETVSNNNVAGVNFTATPVPTYSISGTISPAASGTGATVTLSGAAGATATADSSGNYSFTGLNNGSYTVTPTETGFTFSPVNTPVTVSNANVMGVNFTATANPAGQSLFTTQTPAITNASDGSGVNYELGTSFTSTATGQITAVRFWKASSETGTHTGKIWSSTGTLLASVTFSGETASGWQQQALATPVSISANTTYVVSVNTGNTFYVATSSGLAAQIANGNLRSVVGANGLYGSTEAFPTNSWQNSNYFRDIVFVPGTTYSVSGTITPAASGSGATITLSGAGSATATADGSGNYSFTGLPNGSFTITPSKSGFAFSPTSSPATVNNANVTGINFTATAVPTYSISGTISSSANGSGATVTLSGAASVSTTADTSGNYTFTGLNTGSYTVTPSKSGFTFSPANAPVTVSNSNVTGINFTATASPNQTVFTTQTPAGVNFSDGAGVNYELGMAFTSTAAGQITAIRFWKASNESGTHTGRIWSSTGTLLASVTFAGETASGWQQQALTTPLSIAANTTYVVSVNTGNSYYVASNSGLASAVTNGNLSSIVGNNGLYGSTGQFPANSWQNSNYFRDVVFVAGP